MPPTQAMAMMVLLLKWKWSFYRDTIYLQIGFNTKAGSPGYGFSTCSFPVSFRENNYVLISIFLTLWISLPRRMSLPSCGLGLEVSESFRCFCSFLNVTLRAAFQTAGGGGYTKNPSFFPLKKNTDQNLLMISMRHNRGLFLSDPGPIMIWQ